MKKIPNLIIRDYTKKEIPPIEEMQINPACQWVINGEGEAYRKFDGTACAIFNGQIYVRFDAKLDRKGNRKPIPDDAIPCENSPDTITGHWPHWRPARLPEDKYILEAFEGDYSYEDIAGTFSATFEVCGPKINGNNEKIGYHVAFPHKIVRITPSDLQITSGLTTRKRSLKRIYQALSIKPYEGFVFYHPNGQMAKIRRKDFGLRWPT